MRLGTMIVGCGLLAGLAMQSAAAQVGEAICQGYGPQTPRDIDQHAGTNSHVFSKAPARAQMNLCNIHFHHNAEHKAADFALYAGPGSDGLGGGYQCAMSRQLSAEDLRSPATDICQGLQPGNTIEVHWVYTTCEVQPGPGLGSCLTEACGNPELRVEAQVYTLVNDPDAGDFREMAYGGHIVDGFHQAKAIPEDTGTPLTFLGSTTGPQYTQAACSPLQVSWSVRPQCARLDIHSLGAWCGGNVFEEDHAHGVRQLVTDLSLLSEIHPADH